MAKISIPFNLENPSYETKMQEKEIIAKEHLEEMSEITRSLSYNDIKLLKKENKKREIRYEIQQEDRERNN